MRNLKVKLRTVIWLTIFHQPRWPAVVDFVDLTKKTFEEEFQPMKLVPKFDLGAFPSDGCHSKFDTGEWNVDTFARLAACDRHANQNELFHWPRDSLTLSVTEWATSLREQKQYLSQGFFEFLVRLFQSEWMSRWFDVLHRFPHFWAKYYWDCR